MTPTTDQRERALLYFTVALQKERAGKFDPLDKCCEFEKLMREHGDAIKAALTAPPHVPEEVIQILEAIKEGAKDKVSRELAAEALATLDRVIEGDGWLPIETLPADCKPLGNPRYLTYHKDWGYGINGEQMLNGASPTHCWPLPTPPEEK
jgi:hypothetical protein